METAKKLELRNNRCKKMISKASIENIGAIFQEFFPEFNYDSISNRTLSQVNCAAWKSLKLNSNFFFTILGNSTFILLEWIFQNYPVVTANLGY